MRAWAAIAVAGCVAILAVPAGAAPRHHPATDPHTFSGSCDIAGPISPMPGITVVPKQGARFSFHGSGKCVGLLDARRRERTMDAAIDFIDVTTLFDTCELGPDFNLHGVLTISPPRGPAAQIPIVLNLARLAVIGPFVVKGESGGQGSGTARFAPDDMQAAVTQCGGADGGVTAATLSASFTTSSALTGNVPAARG